MGDAAAQKVFNSGDKIGVSADTQAAVTYTSDGTTWTPAENTYLRWEQETMSFSAYYPVTTGTDTQNFTLPATQSTVDSIAAADYMTTVSVSKNKSEGNISLELSRKTARVIVKIVGFNDQYADTLKYVSAVSLVTYATAYQGGHVLTEATPTPITPYCGNETPVKGGCGAGTTFTALVLPDAAHSDKEFIALTDGTGKSLTVKGIPAHEAGKSYTYNVTVGKDQVQITGVTVADWQTGEPIAGDAETDPTLP
ncbi:MAG: fimbrillin family protein [Parabacteroides sp.]|nr:fimbrillin family protein [Parabacteroides sp.]